MKFLWVILVMTGNTTVPIGYYVSQEACLQASQDAFLVGDNKVIAGWQFACVPVQGLLQR